MKNLTSLEFFEKLTPEQKLLVKQLLETQEEKSVAVKNHDYEKAARLRDQERNLTDDLKAIYDQIIG